MKKRILSAVLAAAMTAGCLTACSSGNTAPAPSSDAGAASTPASSDASQPAATGGDKKEVSLWHYFEGPDADEFNAMTEKYNQENTKGITVKTQFVSRDDLMKQFTMGALSGELPDIGMVDNPDHASFITMGVFQDITDLVDAWGQKDAFFEGPMKSCMQDGKIYGLPHNSNCLALGYDKDKLDAAGLQPPTTWDELKTAAEKLTADGNYGLAISAVNNEEGTFQFMPWFLSSGGSINDLSGEGCVKAVTYLNDLVTNGWMSKDIINWTQNDAVSQFIGGKTAMVVMGPWSVPVVQRDAPNLNFGVTLIPKDKEFSSVLGGENLGICAGKNTDREACFDYLSWMMSAQNTADFCEKGGKFPPRKDSVDLKEVWTKDPIYSVYAQGMEYAQPRGPHPKWPEISTSICNAFHEVYTGANTPEAAMKAAAEKVKGILG